MLNTETINSLVEHQLTVWPEAKQNFDRLMDVRRKELPLGDFNACAQCNPGRVRSTAAKVDKNAIAARPCFLCAPNRPAEQLQAPWPSQEWELLVNPYPIFPIHFTIAHKDHTPQAGIPLEMAMMAEQAPDLAIFYNGARAGASAPDHMHCQGVLKSELPLVALIEKYHPVERLGWVSSQEFGAELPFHFMSGVIGGGLEGMQALVKAAGAFGIDADTGEPDKGLVNAFFWISDKGLLRIAVIPRRAHRPRCFHATDESHLCVSPGAIDMAGMLILPAEEDFDRITPQMARQIYSDTAFAHALPPAIIKHFNP